MKIKKFNEAKNEITDLVDEVLDSLSKKGKLSSSEKAFMDAYSKGNVKAVRRPPKNPKGGFWAVMSDPANVGILWQNEDGVWNLLEEDEDGYKRATSKNELLSSLDKDVKKYICKTCDLDDMKFEARRIMRVKSMFEQNPELKKDLIEYLEELKRIDEIRSDIKKKYERKYNTDEDYEYNQILDRALNGTIDGLMQSFGDYDDDGEPFIYDL